MDDSTIIARGKTLEELRTNIAADFKAVRRYLVNHKMVINPEKTQLMVLNTNHQTEPMQIELNGSVITSQDHIKVLGLTISQDLKFDEYLWRGKGSLVRRLQYRTSMVKNLKPYLKPKTLYQVGNSLINSTIQYGAALWGATSETNIQKVQKVQTRAGRLLTRKLKPTFTPCHRQEMLSSIKWLNVNQLIQVATLNLLKNAISHNSSVGLNSMFRKSHQHSNLRNKGQRVDHKGLTGRNNQTFSSNAANMFNNLPLHLKQSKLTPNQFKQLIKPYILSENLLPEH